MQSSFTNRAAAISTPEETPPDLEPQRLLKSGDFVHLYAMAVGVGIAAAVLIVMINEIGPPNYLGMMFCGSLLLSMACASLFVASAWSVLGSGSYLVRVAWAHLGLIFVGLGYLIGVSLVAGYSGPYFWSDFWKIASVVVLMIPPLSLASQLPLWCFRCFFGWQFTFNDSAPTKAFTLRDIFVFTFFCALSLAAVQFAAKQLANWDGPGEWLTILGFYAVAAGGISLFSIPAVTFAFWSQDFSAACAAMLVYIVGWGLFVVITVAVLNAGSPPAEFFEGLSFLLGSFAASVSVPFMVSKANGFRLSSPSRYQKSKEQSE